MPAFKHANGALARPVFPPEHRGERWRIRHPEEERNMESIAELLRPEDILLDLDVSSRSQLFEIVGQHMESLHGMPRDWVVLSLSRREAVGSTGLGEGVAIPHARIKDLSCIRLAYLRLKVPIPFDAPDALPVGDILVLLVPKEACSLHLALLAEATRRFSAAGFRQRLHRCATASEVRTLFSTWPSSDAAG
jgi:PTS system nitrogen regulatory IIA component